MRGFTLAARDEALRVRSIGGNRVARERPQPPVVAISPNLSTGRLSLVWSTFDRR